MQKWREKVTFNVASSGIEEKTTEADDILDSLILQVKEMDKKWRMEAEELREWEVHILRSGDFIRESAVRSRRIIDEDDGDYMYIESEVGG